MLFKRKRSNNAHSIPPIVLPETDFGSEVLPQFKSKTKAVIEKPALYLDEVVNFPYAETVLQTLSDEQVIESFGASYSTTNVFNDNISIFLNAVGTLTISDAKDVYVDIECIKQTPIPTGSITVGTISNLFPNTINSIKVGLLEIGANVIAVQNKSSDGKYISNHNSLIVGNSSLELIQQDNYLPSTNKANVSCVNNSLFTKTKQSKVITDLTDVFSIGISSNVSRNELSVLNATEIFGTSLSTQLVADNQTNKYST